LHQALKVLCSSDQIIHLITMCCFWFPALLMPVASMLQVNSSTATVTRVTMAAGVKGNGHLHIQLRTVTFGQLTCHCHGKSMRLTQNSHLIL